MECVSGRSVRLPAAARSTRPVVPMNRGLLAPWCHRGSVWGCFGITSSSTTSVPNVALALIGIAKRLSYSGLFGKRQENRCDWRPRGCQR